MGVVLEGELRTPVKTHTSIQTISFDPSQSIASASDFSEGCRKIDDYAGKEPGGHYYVCDVLQ